MLISFFSSLIRVFFWLSPLFYLGACSYLLVFVTCGFKRAEDLLFGFPNVSFCRSSNIISIWASQARWSLLVISKRYLTSKSLLLHPRVIYYRWSPFRFPPNIYYLYKPLACNPYWLPSYLRVSTLLLNLKMVRSLLHDCSWSKSNEEFETFNKEDCIHHIEKV